MLRALIVFLIGCLPALAHAADGASSQVIGYSKDRRYFAFEQYGDQDGSGFPYSDIFVIDISNDTWVKGSPFRVMIEDEEKSISDARRKSAELAKPLLAQLNIEETAQVLVANPFTEYGANRLMVRFDRYYNSMGSYAEDARRGIFEMQVKSIALPQPSNCLEPDFVGMGMELTLRNRESGKSKSIVRDDSIPMSRNCPLDYDIEAIYAPTGFLNGPDPLIALIGVYTRGFEGSDRRFIAVPFELIE